MATSSDTSGWTENFCSRRGNNYFCEVEESYIDDAFNLFGLRPMVSNYSQALGIILDDDEVTFGSEELSDDHMIRLTKSAEKLYGLIHARYIVTQRGLERMCPKKVIWIHQKFLNGDFGYCSCNSPLLPTGTSDIMKVSRMKLLCPKCEVFKNAEGSVIDSMNFLLVLYTPSSVKISLYGAFFGTSFVQMLFLTYSEIRPKSYPTQYVPMVFGFRVHPSAYIKTKKHCPALKPHIGPPINISSDSSTSMEATSLTAVNGGQPNVEVISIDP